MLAHVRAASPGSVLLIFSLDLADLAGISFLRIFFWRIGMAVSESNCHPFRFGLFTFMHNGGIAGRIRCWSVVTHFPNSSLSHLGFSKIKRKLVSLLRSDIYDSLVGTTDSEHAFALFMNHLSDPYGQYKPSTLVEALRVLPSPFSPSLFIDNRLFASRLLFYLPHQSVHYLVAHHRTNLSPSEGSRDHRPFLDELRSL
jgi:hypothetical protein